MKAFETIERGRCLHLFADGSCWLPSEETLLVADLHLGKAAAFRRQGVAIPEGPTQETLEKLSAAVGRIAAKRLIILGDLWHDRGSVRDSTRGEWLAWRDQHQDLDLALVPGNHDRQFLSLTDEARMEVLEPGVCLAGFHLQHAPGGPSPFVCGHIHPTVRVEDGRFSETLKCFWFTDAGLVLPAFGSFTGGSRISRQEGDRVLVCAGTSVQKLPRLPRDRSFVRPF